MDHATAVNDRGELAIFIDPAPVQPDGYRLDGRALTILAGRSEIGTFQLEDIAHGAALAHPERDILVVEMEGSEEVTRTSMARNVAPRTA